MAIPRQPLSAPKEVELVCFLWPIIDNDFSYNTAEKEVTRTIFELMRDTKNSWVSIMSHNWPGGRGLTLHGAGVEALNKKGYLEISPERYYRDGDGYTLSSNGSYQFVRPTTKLMLQLAEIVMIKWQEMPLTVEDFSARVRGPAFAI